jgi:hypothetical protein
MASSVVNRAYRVRALPCSGTPALAIRLEREQDRTMDVNNILQQLRDERAQLEQAIMATERLAVSGQSRRRGRPPKWLAEQRTEQQPLKKRGRPPGKKSTPTG